ncbi:uncharacterized protein LOC106138149 [Amyelois transitella]|uniref:uncharacterized protein LOC106138149 n=1 Tax=Amyelois transitella TaxID=680683 RepID=UPI00298FF22F|nr:uncharacterized protein LOC106138149 [Amyelois transitella]
MWPQKGMKTDHCPCCKACKSCSGFQKLLDAREAGFVLYRHTTLVKDIDHKKGGIQVVTDSINDVFILENRQGIALETVDFTPELGNFMFLLRNKIKSYDVKLLRIGKHLIPNT